MRNLIINKFLPILLLSLFISCEEQIINSHSSDDKLGGTLCESSLSASEMRFCKSQNIITKRCISCHTGYHSDYSSYIESDYDTENLMTPGDSENSTLITILINNGGNMPKAGKPIPNEEVETLKEWIDNYVAE